MCDQLLLTILEVAAKLRLGRSLTYRLIQTGELRSLKIGGSRRVAVVDLEEFVEKLRDATEGE